VRFTGEPPGRLVVVGGVQLGEGSRLADDLPELLRALAGARKNGSVQMAAERHGGVLLHRIAGNAPPPNAQRLFGASPALYVGADPRALWFALGGETALPMLRQTMDRVNASGGGTQRSRQDAPLRLDVHAGQWVATLGSDLGNSPAERELMRNAFARGQDTARIDVATSENGLRLRLELQEGFVRLVGLGIVRQMDRR
jgi:hypothetical protein